MRTVVAVMIMLVLSMAALAQPDTIAASWEKQYQYKDYALMAAACKNTDMLIARRTLYGSLQLTRIDASGKERWDSVYPALYDYGLVRTVTGIKEDEEGNFYLLINMERTDPVLAKMNRNGKQLFIQPLLVLQQQKTNSFAHSLFLSDSSIICYGVKGGKFWEGVYATNGLVRSEMLFNLKSKNIITDILINSRHAPVVVTKEGNFDKYGGGPSSTHIMQLNYESKSLESIISVKGKNGKLAELPDAGYALLLDEAVLFPRQDIHLLFFDRNFSLRKKASVFANAAGASPFHLQAYGKEALMIQGVKDGMLQVMLANGNGQLTRTLVYEKNDVLAVQQAFVNRREPGCLLQFRGELNGSDPITAIRKKLLLFRLN
jgi:hypothetical protein